MENVIVSVLMTSYNREKFIGEAIQSVINQDFSDWELIIVDDQSSDTTISIAQRFAVNDKRIKVFVNEKNLGDYPNRNKAASYATGRYIKYLDADDLLYPHALRIMVDAMERFPDAGWGVMDPDPLHTKVYPYILEKQKVWELGYFNGWRIFGRSPLSLIIERDLFNRIGGFSGKQHVGDFELIHILACESPMVAFNGDLGWYRVHEDQQSNDNRTDHFVPFKYFKIRLDTLRCLDVPLTLKDRRRIEQNTVRQASKMMLNELLHFKISVFKKMKEHIEWSTFDFINNSFNSIF